jgi:D-amino-acid dehydrogenase
MALASRGSSVELLEAEENIAQGTSFANGGMLVPSMSDPWNGPGVLKHLLTSLLVPGSTIRLKPSVLPGLLGWGTRFLANSSRARYHDNALANFVLARYSVQQTLEWSERLKLSFNQAQSGSLKMFRDVEDRRALIPLLQLLGDAGLRYELLDKAETLDHEPALKGVATEVGASVYFPDDVSGDAFAFCEALAQQLPNHGVLLRTRSPVKRILMEDGRVRGVQLADGNVAAEHVVVAAGVSAHQLLLGLGVRLPVVPVKGYSLTLNIPEGRQAPRVAVVDDRSHAVVVTLGQELRAVGGAEFAGHDRSLDAGQLESLFAFVKRILPELTAGLNLSDAKAWSGLRPMSHDGKPFIGPTPVRGLYLNAGHGHLGWTQAVGSAEILADMICGKPPRIDVTPYLYGR